MSLLKPRQAEQLDDFGSRLQHRILTALTAKVTAVNGRTVDVTCLQQYPGEKALKLTEVPIVHLGTAEMAVMVGVGVGAEGLVIFHKLDPSDAWRLNDVAEVQKMREHGTYGEFIPRRAALDTEAEWPEAGEIRVGKLDASLELRISADAITLKAPTVNLVSESPSDAAALASLVDQLFTTLKSAVASGLTAVGVGVAANGPAGATAFNAAFNPTSVASSGVKLE